MVIFHSYVSLPEGTIVYWHEHNLDVWLAHPQQFFGIAPWIRGEITPCQVNQDTTNCPPERHAPCRLPRVETCQALEIIAKLRTYGAQSDAGYIVHCTSSKLHTHTHIYISHIFDQYCSIIETYFNNLCYVDIYKLQNPGSPGSESRCHAVYPAGISPWMVYHWDQRAPGWVISQDSLKIARSPGLPWFTISWC